MKRCTPPLLGLAHRLESRARGRDHERRLAALVALARGHLARAPGRGARLHRIQQAAKHKSLATTSKYAYARRLRRALPAGLKAFSV